MKTFESLLPFDIKTFIDFYQISIYKKRSDIFLDNFFHTLKLKIYLK